MVLLRCSWTYFKANVNLKFITVLHTFILEFLRLKNWSKTGLNQLRPRPVQDHEGPVFSGF